MRESFANGRGSNHLRSDRNMYYIIFLFILQEGRNSDQSSFFLDVIEFANSSKIFKPKKLHYEVTVDAPF